MSLRLPQTRDFDKLRKLLQLVANGERDLKKLGIGLGAKKKWASRHARYHREMAEVLGLMPANRWELTAAGRGLIRTEPESEEERVLLRRAVEGAEQLGDFREAILSEHEPDLEALIGYAARELPLAASTLDHRVKGLLRWRERLASPAPVRPTAHAEGAGSQLELWAARIDQSEWPRREVTPFNWPKDRVHVEESVYADLGASGEVLLVLGYTSLQHLCHFVAGLQPEAPRRVRVVFGTEPFHGKSVPVVGDAETIAHDVRDHWLERGISIVHAVDVLATVDALERGRVLPRVSRRRQGQHAKLYLGEAAATVGSSNFTYPGLRTQLEANARVTEAGAPGHFKALWKLGEVYWKLSVDYREGLLGLLRELLRKVTWQEALARACAELLEGEWARRHVHDVLGYGQQLWPAQLQGIGQALYTLMDVGSVLMADATGSGKTRTGAWLLRALRERLVTSGRAVPDPVLVVPPAVREHWADELGNAGLGVEPFSQGVLSSSRAGSRERVLRRVGASRVLAIDEAHGFLQRSNRTAAVMANLADHVVLFTATPINRDVSDLLGIADLLGADNLDDATIRILEDVAWRPKRQLSSEDEELLRREVRRFTVRRTKSTFNLLIDREPGRYVNRLGNVCRYPDHLPKYYRLHESADDREVGSAITTSARRLRGVLSLRKEIRLTKTLLARGWTPQKYAGMREKSARALARYQVRLALRSSRAALWEHLHGTVDAKVKFSVPSLEKSKSGDVFAKLQNARRRGPPKSAPEMRRVLSKWLVDDKAYRRAVDEEVALYREIAKQCEQLSDGRERAKARLLERLLDDHGLVLAFDSRPITLEVLRRKLRLPADRIFVASGSRKGARSRVREAFSLGSKVSGVVALCTNAMSEGINLQHASVVVHLDMPSVVRIAEQRVGRIHRMDSPHGSIASWWPRDAPEFALASDEKLDERLDLVNAILGANVTLPNDDAPRVVSPEEMVDEMKAEEHRQLELLDVMSQQVVEG